MPWVERRWVTVYGCRRTPTTTCVSAAAGHLFIVPHHDVLPDGSDFGSGAVDIDHEGDVRLAPRDLRLGEPLCGGTIRQAVGLADHGAISAELDAVAVL